MLGPQFALWSLIFAAVAPIGRPDTDAETKTDKKVMVCYYGSWAVYSKGDGKFDVEDIDPYVCTHIIYSFAILGNDSTIESLDPCNDLDDNGGNGAFRRFTELKKENPDLKALLAIGGWEEGSEKYSKMASRPETRAKFVHSVVEMLQKYNFDGLDFDWEYPALRGGIPEDKVNFITILNELKEAFKPYGYLLTAAVGAGRDTIDTAYDIPAMSNALDHIHVMGYDYHGNWDPYTGHNAPLYANPTIDSGKNAWFNQNYTINYFIDNGAPPSKLVLGMPLYGHSYLLANASDNGLYAPVSPPTDSPEAYGDGGGGYRQICKRLASEPGWTIVRDPYYQAPYAYRDRLWIGYDDQESLKAKAEYAVSKNLLGAMIWAIESDDFHGTCHGEPFVLIKTITSTMNGASIQPKTRIARSPRNQKPKPVTRSSCRLTGKPTEPTESSASCQSNGALSFQNAADDDCAKFHQCVPNGSGMTIVQMKCPAGTVFDPNTKTCNFAYLVPGCEKYYFQKLKP